MPQLKSSNEDPPEIDWSPPEYATEANNDDEWSPPEYAQAVKVEEPKKSVFSRVISALKPAERIHPGGKVIDIQKEDIGNPSSEERIKAVNELKDPGEGTYFRDHPDLKQDDSMSRFLSGVASVPKQLYNTVNEIGRKGSEQLRQGNIPGAFRTAISPLMGPIDTVNEFLVRRARGEQTPGISKDEAREEGAAQILSAAGLPGKEAIEAYKKGDYASLAGMGLTASVVAGAFHKLGSESSVKTERELPVRQTGKLSNRLTDTTPQQDSVAIAQTREGVPRTPANISIETGIPKASIRRTISEIRQKTNSSQEESLPVRQTINDYIKSNPEAKMSDIEDFVKTVQTPERTAAIEESQSQSIYDKFREDNLAREMEERDRLRGTPEDVSHSPTAQEVERRRLSAIGGEEQTPTEQSSEEIQKPNFVNPFEKPTQESELATKLSSYGEGSILPSNSRPTELNLEQEWIPPSYAEEKVSGQPKAEFLALNEQKEPMYNIVENGKRYTFTGPDELTKRGINIPETPKDAIPMRGSDIRDKMLAEKAGKEWKPPEYARSVERGEETKREEIPEFEKSTTLKGKLQELEDAAHERIKQRGTFSGKRLLSGLPVDDLADLAIIGATKIARGIVKFSDWSEEMISHFGESVKPHLREIFNAAKDKHSEFTGGAVRKLFNSMIEAKGANLEQQGINKAEQAKRFAAFEGVREEGAIGAAKSLSKLKGQFEKVNPGEGINLNEDESNLLFTTIKRSNISTPEKARAYTALNALFNGDRVPQQNELKILDKIFGKYMKKVSGPGASGGYDIESFGKGEFEKAGEKLSKKPDDYLTKLANFSSKTTRTVLGFHVPGTALSFHGFNEAIRNTLFGPNPNPFQAAKRFGEASYYLIRPGKAQEFLDINMEDLGKAIEEGGLKAHTGDIGISPMFKGSNIITKGINALSNPKPLFGQVIPALKLKSYQGLLAQYEKAGIAHNIAAKTAGEATNNIFGGLNLRELERSPNTQKLFRIAALAPDWLESNVRLGKGMFNSIKNPTNPKNKVYMTGIVNFLGSYIALNVLNAINNDGKFAFQNDVGHEFDIAIGRDSSGRIRYFAPYGTAMDMVRIPLEIGHAAIEGNLGKGFSDLRSRASEPLQFLTDLATNTDYAGRALYDKNKYGKPIPKLEQMENIVGDAAGHFLPIGAESGVNLAQGKISPEQFASQVLQLPMKYKFPERNPMTLKIRKSGKLH